MAKISLNIDQLQSERQQLADFLASPSAYADAEFSSKNRRFTELESIIEIAKLRETLESQLIEAKELSTGDDELAEIAKIES